MFYSNQSNSVRRLSRDEVIGIAPSVVTVNAHDSLSQRYSPISTMDIVDILDTEGWYPVKVQEVHARKENTAGYQKHLIRFQHQNLMLGDENIEFVLTNSHDGKSAYKFLLGIFRLVCSNGLIVGDTFEQLCLRHVGLEQSMVSDASRKMIEFAPKLAGSVDQMKQIELSYPEQRIYAESAAMLLFPKIEEKEEVPVDANQLLRARRYDDRNGTDLWTTYNKVQENVMKGGLHFRNKETRRNQSTRKVKAIDKNVTLNRALWNLTDQMMKLKASE